MDILSSMIHLPDSLSDSTALFGPLKTRLAPYCLVFPVILSTVRDVKLKNCPINSRCFKPSCPQEYSDTYMVDPHSLIVVRLSLAFALQSSIQ